MGVGGSGGHHVPPPPLFILFLVVILLQYSEWKPQSVELWPQLLFVFLLRQWLRLFPPYWDTIASTRAERRRRLVRLQFLEDSVHGQLASRQEGMVEGLVTSKQTAKGGEGRQGHTPRHDPVTSS